MQSTSPSLQASHSQCEALYNQEGREFECAHMYNRAVHHLGRRACHHDDISMQPEYEYRPARVIILMLFAFSHDLPNLLRNKNFDIVSLPIHRRKLSSPKEFLAC